VEVLMKKLTASAEKGIAPTLADLKELAIARWLFTEEQDKQLQLWTDAALGGTAAAVAATADADSEPAAKRKKPTCAKTVVEDKLMETGVASYFK
jgi:hypothetical protein